jgi:hypothetical protein
MKVTPDGHFVFHNTEEVLSAIRLARGIHKEGLVNTSHEIWKTWVSSDYGKLVMEEHIIVLVWCTVFLQRLMFSIICHLEGVDL